jgi:hypothetical protein
MVKAAVDSTGWSRNLHWGRSLNGNMPSTSRKSYLQGKFT